MTEPLAGIWIGGRSARMGGEPKAMLPAPDGTGCLLARTVSLARRLGLDVVLVGEAQGFDPGAVVPGVPVLADTPSDIGPVGGLNALLEHAGTRRVIALACDMPYVSEALLERLRRTDCTAAVLAPYDPRTGRYEPFFARYDAARIRYDVANAIARGAHSMQALLSRIEVEHLALAPEEWAALRDWDTPSDRTRETVTTARGCTDRAVLRNGVESRDAVVVEEPLEIRIQGETVATTMRTPGADSQLVLGFLFGEGIIHGAGDVGSILPCGRMGEEGYGNVVDVIPVSSAKLDWERVSPARRGTITSASCGVCGRKTIGDLMARCAEQTDNGTISPARVCECVKAMRASQPLFEKTGGVHAAAAFASDGTRLALHEDVGRHNAVDKVVGELLLAGRIPAHASLLVVSGRASFEMVQKVVNAGIPVLASVSAPSSLAVDLALRTRTTLVGFVRGERMNVYAGRERLREEPRTG